LLLGKLSISKVDESFDEVSDEGKKMLSEVTYIELILSIDVKTSDGKNAFNLVQGWKTMDYPDGNAAIAWERLKNKYEPISAPSMTQGSRSVDYWVRRCTYEAWGHGFNYYWKPIYDSCVEWPHFRLQLATCFNGEESGG
jgi:hypothetical protein